VTVRRVIGTPVLRNLDPFLMLDFFGSDDPQEYIAGFPDHPHRGFITVTYMLDGHMLHRDSMGNEGNLQSGGVQWMKAASGIIHSEMPQQDQGLLRGFQLWLNLPAREKMSRPEYQEFAATKFPVVKTAAGQVKVLCGRYADANGPISDPNTEVTYLDVSLDGGVPFHLALEPDRSSFVLVYEGALRIDDTELGAPELAVLGGEQMTVTGSGRMIFVSGKPLRERIVQYGPFVMNSEDEIEQALRDYRDGRLVRDRAGFIGIT